MSRFARTAGVDVRAGIAGLVAQPGTPLRVFDCHERAMSSGADACVEADVDGEFVWGVGIHASIVTASLRAVVVGVNRALLLSEQREAALRAVGSERAEPRSVLDESAALDDAEADEPLVPPAGRPHDRDLHDPPLRGIARMPAPGTR